MLKILQEKNLIAFGVLTLSGLSAGWASAQNEGNAIPIYTKDTAPQTPQLESLEQTEKVTQYGITWTFDKKVRVGRFITGDYYVVGPVTVSEIDPKPLFGKEIPESELDKREIDKKFGDKCIRHGSMLNPPATQQVTYDSGIKNQFAPELISKPPYALKPGDTLISSISLKQGESAKFSYHSGGKRTAGDNCPTKVAAVLSCVAEPQPPDAFRPAYCDRKQVIYLARNLRRELLPKVERVKCPDPVTFAEVFQKPWVNSGFFGFDEPMENMPHYGQWVGEAAGNGALILCMDFKPEEKERLLLNYVQVGIDYWGMVKSGHPGWQAWGGHGSGRKLPIVFAGYLLGDEQMACPNQAFPKCEFGEDNQTRYGQSWGGAQVVFAGHSGIQSNSGKVSRPAWGPYEHLPPSEWKKNGLNGSQSEAYRRANTSRCWPSEALVLRIMKLEKLWAHDPFLDYMDRWMYEDDKAMRKEIAKYIDKLVEPENDNHFANEGQTGESWVKPAWDKYRTLPGMPPTDGWKQKKEGPSIPPEYLTGNPQPGKPEKGAAGDPAKTDSE